jgi:hypothetical protein
MTSINNHKRDKFRTEYTASRVELKMMRAYEKKGVDDIKIKILMYLRVRSNLEMLSLANRKC